MNIDEMVLKIEIADRLNQESYRIWDSAKVIKNQDYHDGLVKGLKMAAKFVAKLWIVAFSVICQKMKKISMKLINGFQKDYGALIKNDEDSYLSYL